MDSSRFVQLDPDIFENDKVLRAATELGHEEHEDLVALSFISVLCYCRKHAPDGNLEGLGWNGLCRVLRWHGGRAPGTVVEAMLKVGFLGDEPLRVVNFKEQHKRLLANNRNRNYRERQRHAAEAESVPARHGASQKRHEKEKEKEKGLKEHVDYNGDFQAWWTAYGKVGGRADAVLLYSFWRQQGADPEALLAAAKTYHRRCLSERGPDGKLYQKMAATFLAKKPNRWEEYAGPEEEAAPETVPLNLPHDLTTEERRPTCIACGAKLTPDDEMDGGHTKRGWVCKTCWTTPGGDPVMESYEVDAIIFGEQECVRCRRSLPACRTYFKMDRGKATGLKATCRDCTAGYDYGRVRSDAERAAQSVAAKARYARNKR